MNVTTNNTALRSGLNLLLVLAGVLILFCQYASAATYYVSTNGGDSNAGTQSAPFRHLTKGALAATQPGDTVIVMDGTYDNEGVVAPNFVVTLYYSGTAGNPITFKAQNRGKAILDSMNTSTSTTCNGASSYLNLHNASFIVIQGFVIQRGCDSGIQSNDSAHDVTIKWNEIRNIANHTVTDQIGRDGIYLNSSEYNFTFDGNMFHDIGRTDGQTYLHFDHGIYSHSHSTTIINNQFYNMNRGWSVQLADGANNWTVANNTFAFGDANGESGQIMFWGANSNIAVMNNIFYKPNGSAMNQYAATLSNCSFNHNLVYGVSTILSGGTSGLTTGTNSIGATPMFVNASSAPYDFHEQSGSASINAGIYLAAVPLDADGVSRPQSASTDQGAYEYVATTPPPVISGVFVSGISTDSAFINWSTDKPATSYVQYGPTGYTNTTPTDPTLVTVHSVSLSGLAASSLYHFRVGSTNSAGGATLSPDYTVTTLAVPSTISVSAFSCTPVMVTPPSSSNCTVGLTAAALASGATVTLSSSSAAANVPPTVTVLAGATSTTFNVTFQPVSIQTPITLKATYLGVSVTFGLTINPTTAGTGSAAFVKTDAITSGSWKGVYGADGFNVINDTVSYPSYVTVTPSGNALYNWTSSTTDVRDLQRASSPTDRIAACWYSGSSFTVDLNFKDTSSHQVALYLLDWDNYYGRTERVDILDANNTLLDSRSVSSFVNGLYLVWNLSGHVIVRITNTNPSSNAVIGGLFFGQGGSSGSTGSAAFVKTDAITSGSWKGVYGADGFNVINDTVSYPSYVTVTPSGNALYNWAFSTTDVRDLQRASSTTDRIAACWYSGSSFTVDLNFKDTSPHQVALYLLDWDNYYGRTERVDILDANNTLLDSRSVYSFVNGLYLVWNLSGHVIVNITNTNSNAVMSGLFFR